MPGGDDATSFVKLKDPAKQCIRECVEPFMRTVAAYDIKEYDTWVERIGDDVLAALQKLSNNFKYIVNINIVEKKGAGLHTETSAFWDAEIDGAASYRFENNKIICFVQMFGLGI
mmetsp:Transcript_21901/g.61475  ORF Transcript_21901/g.61475 Transcript_21901/m.61475 type:complete len:115 (+) Transcript_21901:123-467(+)